MNKSTFSRFKSVTSNFLHQLFHSPSRGNPNLVGRNHNHLKDPYRRCITSPDAALSKFTDLVFNDDNLIDALGRSESELVVRAAIIGDSLRVNAYRLDRFPVGQLCPVYNENWRSEDILDWHVVITPKAESLSRRIMPLRAAIVTDLSYDWFEPILSYERVLTGEELATISDVTRPCWKQLS